jgi:glycosyltransferase involved in cell wall biosynthesis
MTQSRIDILHAVTSPISLVLLRGQVAHLRSGGFQPAVLCGPGPQVEDWTAKESVPVFTVAMQREISPLRDLISLFRIWRLLRRLRLIVCNAGTPKAGLLVGVAAWLSRVPCRIYTLRGLRLETATGLKRRVLRLTERITCACAHRVICVSPSLRQRAIELGLVPSTKTVVLAAGSSNGVDPSRFMPTPQRLARAADLRRELRIEPDRRVIGYVGRFTRDKGILELWEAFALLRRRFANVVLLLVGSFEEGDAVSPELRRVIENDVDVRQVEFTNDVAPYYLLMDVFVLPTHREGFPNTVLEAQAAERPVITTFATGAVDSIVDGVTGTIVPVQASAPLADALLALLTDPQLAQRMGRAGRERVVSQFRQEIVWEELAGLYREMLVQRKLPVPLPTEHKSRAICLEKS